MRKLLFAALLLGLLTPAAFSQEMCAEQQYNASFAKLIFRACASNEATEFDFIYLGNGILIGGKPPATVKDSAGCTKSAEIEINGEKFSLNKTIPGSAFTVVKNTADKNESIVLFNIFDAGAGLSKENKEKIKKSYAASVLYFKDKAEADKFLFGQKRGFRVYFSDELKTVSKEYKVKGTAQARIGTGLMFFFEKKATLALLITEKNSWSADKASFITANEVAAIKKVAPSAKFVSATGKALVFDEGGENKKALLDCLADKQNYNDFVDKLI